MKEIKFTPTEIEILKEMYSTPRKQLRDEFYLEYGREKMNLETTRSVASVWAELIKKDMFKEKWNELEEIIGYRARLEWGDKTTVDFNRQTRTVLVRNNQNSKTLSF